MKKAAPEPTQVPFPGKLKDLGDSFNDEFNNFLANQIVNTLWLNTDPDQHIKQFQAAFAPLIGIKPADEIEGMLAAQMVATYHAAMECFRHSTIREQTFEGRHESLNQANKLIRSYAVLLETLNRHRGKGQQKVTVEHVHVHSGGQAIVGAVQGGGVTRKTEEQPYAPSAITHELGTSMRGPGPEREAVPIASGAGKAPL